MHKIIYVQMGTGRRNKRKRFPKEIQEFFSTHASFPFVSALFVLVSTHFQIWLGPRHGLTQIPKLKRGKKSNLGIITVQKSPDFIL